MFRDVKYAKYYMDIALEGKIIKIDDNFTNITGYTWDDVLENEMTILDLVTKERRKEYEALLYGFLEAGEAYLNHEVACKDGKIIWINCFGEMYMDENTGHQCAKILIIDVTEQENAVNELSEKEEQLELQIEKLKFLTENSQEIFFDYDIQKDKLEISRFTKGEYEIFYSKENYISTAYETVHNDDLARYYEVLNMTRNSEKRAVFDFRSKVFTGDYRWFRLVYAKYINPKTDKSHIVGRMFDINDEKLASWHKTLDEQMDSLTGIYTSEAVEKKINEILDVDARKITYTMLLIDIDHLKVINSEFGYHVGDIILEKISGMLCEMFRQNYDIIGRASGDSFVVFIRNTIELNYIEKQCIEICERLKKEFEPINSRTAAKITVSIGVAFGDGKTDSYKQIFKKAQKALQNQRKNGRNGYSF